MVTVAIRFVMAVTIEGAFNSFGLVGGLVVLGALLVAFFVGAKWLERYGKDL